MGKLNLVFVIGEAATGKTTLAGTIAKALALPLLSKDALKVILFDALGWNDRDWSRKIGAASYDLMDYVILQHLEAGNSLVIESTFQPEFANPKFREWQKRYSFTAIQVYCHADKDVVIERFKRRAHSDSRHVSHVEGEEGLADLTKRLAENPVCTLDLAGNIIDVDTTDFGKVDSQAIASQVKALM